MARMIPANFPDLDPDETRSRKSERKVFNLLKNAPGTEGWIVLYSVLLPDERPDAKRRRRKPESDFVILVPDYGFV